MTVLSLLQTMLLWAMSRRWFLAPPPHNLTLMSRAMGKFLLGERGERIVDAEVSNDNNNVIQEEQMKAASIENNKREWQFVFTTFHVFLSIVFVFAYVVGILIILYVYWLRLFCLYCIC